MHLRFRATMEWAQVVSIWDEFSTPGKKSVKGKEPAVMHCKELPSCEFMVTTCKWPVRSVVLDNQANSLPSTFTYRGPTRFSLASYLASVGKLVKPMTFQRTTPVGP